ncbi:hypothetical protein JYT83_00420 [bacterium AH-315-F18]|nr:hypothetical protein [bacterium AH-315-F18]
MTSHVALVIVMGAVGPLVSYNQARQETIASGERRVIQAGNPIADLATRTGPGRLISRNFRAIRGVATIGFGAVVSLIGVAYTFGAPQNAVHFADTVLLVMIGIGIVAGGIYLIWRGYKLYKSNSRSGTKGKLAASMSLNH